MKNDDFGRLVALLARDPSLFHALVTRGADSAKRAAELLPSHVVARSPPGTPAKRIAIALARTVERDLSRAHHAPLGPCVDSCEASRLVDGPVPAGRARLDVGALLGAACDANVTCCCTSGTCGGPTCGGSTCDVTCSGDSCGSTCGDSCGTTTNLERFTALERGAAHGFGRHRLGCDATCGVTVQPGGQVDEGLFTFAPQAWRWR